MKFGSMIKYVGFTGTYRDYTVTTGPDAVNDRTYLPGTIIEFNGGTANNSSSMIIYTKKRGLRMFAHVEDVRDRNGAPITVSEYNPVGATYEVRSVQPLLNPWGLIEGYRHTLVAVG